jgi:hypothetical protein
VAVSSEELRSLAQDLGARDLFLFQVVAPGRLVNVDGYGRGAGWAGNIEVQQETEPWLAQAMGEGTARLSRGFPTRAFGPYWTAEAAAVWTGEYLVVFGGDGMGSLDPANLLDAAQRAAGVAAETPVAKRLADDLEVAQAALAVATVSGSNLREVAEGVAARTAEALGCEFGVVYLFGSPPRAHMVDLGWRPAATEDEVATALAPVAYSAATSLQVEQDLADSPLAYPPLSFHEGLVSRCSVGIGPDGSIGVLSVAHAGDRPRGFTSLCQRIMVSSGQAAEAVLGAFLRGDRATA